MGKEALLIAAGGVLMLWAAWPRKAQAAAVDQSAAVAYPVPAPGVPYVNAAAVSPVQVQQMSDGYSTVNGGNMASMPRGIRNNNPLNIEDNASNNWEGLASPRNDGRYCRFLDARYGIRAGVKILRSYKARGLVTVEQIIGQWAPEFENNVTAYINSVVSRSGIGRGVAVSESQYPALITAMVYHENGMQPYSAAFIREGISWAG